MNERDIVDRLGTRNRHDGTKEKNPIPTSLPTFTMTGTQATSNQIRKGLGRYWFVCYPHSTYRPTEDDLKPFKEHIKKNPVSNGIERDDGVTVNVTNTTSSGSGSGTAKSKKADS